MLFQHSDSRAGTIVGPRTTFDFRFMYEENIKAIWLATYKGTAVILLTNLLHFSPDLICHQRRNAREDSSDSSALVAVLPSTFDTAVGVERA